MKLTHFFRAATISTLITSCAMLQSREKQYSLANDGIYLKLDYETGITASSFDALGNSGDFSLESILATIPKPNTAADSLEYFKIVKSLDSMYQVNEIRTSEMIRKMDSLKETDTFKNFDGSQPYYIFKDSSITVSDYGTELIYPKISVYKRWFKNTKDSSFYGQMQTAAYQMEIWNPKNKVTIDKSKKKTINGIEGSYYHIVQRISSSYYGTIDIVNEGFFNPGFDIPFDNYQFLELKGLLNLKGLVLENKNYQIDNDGKSGESSVTLKRITAYDKSTFSLKDFIESKYGKHITSLANY